MTSLEVHLFAQAEAADAVNASPSASPPRIEPCCRPFLRLMILTFRCFSFLQPIEAGAAAGVQSGGVLIAPTTTGLVATNQPGGDKPAVFSRTNQAAALGHASTALLPRSAILKDGTLLDP